MTKRLTPEQLQKFRNHAAQYPVGDIAQLLAHIDDQRDRFVAIRNLLESVVSPNTRGQEYWLDQIYGMLREGGE